MAVLETAKKYIGQARETILHPNQAIATGKEMMMEFDLGRIRHRSGVKHISRYARQILAPNIHLSESVYSGSLARALAVPVIPPPRLISTDGRPIFRWGTSLTVLPEEDAASLVKWRGATLAGDATATLPQRLHDKFISQDEVDPRELVLDGNRAADPILSFLRLALLFNADKRVVAGLTERLRKFWFDDNGKARAPAERKASTASLIPLFYETDLRLFVENLSRVMNGGEFLGYTLGSDDAVEMTPFIKRVMSQRERDTRWNNSTRLAGATLTAAIGLAEIHGLEGAHWLAPYILPAAQIVSAGIALGGGNLRRLVTMPPHSDDSRLQDVKHLQEGGKLIRQLIEQDLNGSLGVDTYFPPMMLDAFDMVSMRRGKLLTTSGEAVLEKIKRAPVTLKQIGSVDSLHALSNEQRELIRMFVPENRTIPLSEMMKESLRVVEIGKYQDPPKKHQPVKYPHKADLGRAIDRMGLARLKAVKELQDNEAVLSICLPAAHRVGTFPDKQPGFLTDSIWFAKRGHNPGGYCHEITLLPEQYYLTQRKMLDGSQEQKARLAIYDGIEKGPLGLKRNGLQYINTTANPLPTIALWSKDNSEDVNERAQVKEFMNAFDRKVIPLAGENPAYLDYALRLISATVFYEKQADELKAHYHNVEEVAFDRAQMNLRAVRAHMIDKVLGVVTAQGPKEVMTNSPDMLLHTLIALFQEDPEYMALHSERLLTLFSTSGLKGSFDAPQGSVGTTWASLCKYLGEPEMTDADGRNMFGMEAEKVKETAKNIKDKLIFERLEDMITHVFGIKTRSKLMNDPKFEEKLALARTFFDKTIKTCDGAQRIELVEKLEEEMKAILIGLSNYVRTEGDETRDNYRHNIRHITELAQLLYANIDTSKHDIQHGGDSFTHEGFIQFFTESYDKAVKERNASAAIIA